MIVEKFLIERFIKLVTGYFLFKSARNTAYSIEERVSGLFPSSGLEDGVLLYRVFGGASIDEIIPLIPKREET